MPKQDLVDLFEACDNYVQDLKKSNSRLRKIAKDAAKQNKLQSPSDSNFAWKALGCMVGGLGTQAAFGKVGWQGLAGSGACFLVLELGF